MALHKALDYNNNDLIKTSQGTTRVSDGRATVQIVRCKLRTLLGELSLSPELGWLEWADYERNPDLFGLEIRAKSIILGTQGVQKIDTFTISLDARVVSITFTATTIYGTIDLTVPWST